MPAARQPQTGYTFATPLRVGGIHGFQRTATGFSVRILGKTKNTRVHLDDDLLLFLVALPAPLLLKVALPVAQESAVLVPQRRHRRAGKGASVVLNQAPSRKAARARAMRPPDGVRGGTVAQRGDGGQDDGGVAVGEHVGAEASRRKTRVAVAHGHVARRVAEGTALRGRRPFCCHARFLWSNEI